ncbi:MAG TPA: hypothetical protein VMK12_08440, partial [Anaeromyxobacteraceae bacterium]|nr:hypothetical protein [Anaeromyxobacteraceae bacterium]
PVSVAYKCQVDWCRRQVLRARAGATNPENFDRRGCVKKCKKWNRSRGCQRLAEKRRERERRLAAERERAQASPPVGFWCRARRKASTAPSPTSPRYRDLRSTFS